jgi:hypothetical protein
MKHTLALLATLLLATVVVWAAGPERAGATSTATLLKEPADWRFEAMAMPPGFAPDIKLTGLEEIRFAPGMFNTGSSNYFTYVVALLTGGAPELGAADLKDFLEKYYRGLSLAVGRGKGLSPDPGQMKAEVKQAKAKNSFTAQIFFFDTFSDGRKITLNVEAQVVPRPVSKQTLLLLLVSPSAKDAPVWQILREIGRKQVGAN